MIYHYIRRYLKNVYEKPSLKIKWSQLDNIKFFHFIEDRYTMEEFRKELSEAKEAFRDFFEPIGTLLFRYKEDNGIAFKILPYSIEAKDSKYLSKLIHIIQNNRKAILYPYNNQNNQLAITGKIRRAINAEIYDIKESVNKKELIKYAIRKALDLSERDIVIQLKRIYLVKILQENQSLPKVVTKEKTELDKEKANRYNGYSQEQFEETYKKLFKLLLRIFLRVCVS